MSRPWKHPKTGVYWLRKRVPLDLRASLHKAEEKRSLRTRDPGEAKRLHSQALQQLETRWASLRSGPKQLSEREAHELAAPIYGRFVEHYRDNPSDQTFWCPRVGEKLWRFEPIDLNRLDPTRDGAAEFFRMDPDFLKRVQLQEWCLTEADACLKLHGLIVDQVSREKLAKAVGAAVQRASVQLASMARGEFGAPNSSTPVQQLRQPNGAGAVSLEKLVEGWAAEKRPSQKTLYEWRRVISELARFLGHDDASRITVDDLIQWKSALVEKGLRAKTIRDAKIAPVRAILGSAFHNRMLQSNPAERIIIQAKTKAGERKRGFTDEEARTVLAAAAVQTNPVRHWVPLLGAYSGARVSEICQLRSEDILQIEGIWAMRLVPEAGSIKTEGSERVVPLHRAVLQGGFLDFAKASHAGPLFKDLKRDRFGNRGGNGTKVIGRWVRSMGLTDRRLSPNHSWRHRMRTLGRRYGLATDILDAITGHQRKSAGDAYGEFPIQALARELAKIPQVLGVRYSGS